MTLFQFKSLKSVPKALKPYNGLKDDNRTIDFPRRPKQGDQHMCINPIGGASWQTWGYTADGWVLEKDE